MGADQHLDWTATAASALDWWQEAGVDVLVDEGARDWLAPVAAPAKPVAARPAPAVEQPPAPLPDALAPFLAWRMGDDAPEAGWPGARVPAEGAAGAALMVLVDQPDREDLSEGRLLSGAAGRLFDRMLAAIGLTRAAIYLAPVCHARIARTSEETLAALHAAAAQHVRLAAPQRLLLLGNAASRALLSTDVAPARGRLHALAGKDAPVSAVASFHPRFLLERPACKADAWRDLQLLMKEPAA